MSGLNMRLKTHPLPLLDEVSPFEATFERATDRAVEGLSGLVADALAEREESLGRLVRGQNQTLHAIAQMIDLDVGELEAELPDGKSERRARRDAWHTAAMWSLMTLLWTLVRPAPDTVGIGDWADVAHERGLRPPGRSSLDDESEFAALQIAAEALADSQALRDGRALFLLDTPVTVWRQADEVHCRALDPVMLISRRGDGDAAPPTLAVGDEVWTADKHSPPWSQELYRVKGPGRYVITQASEVKVDSALQIVAISSRTWCYARGS